MNDREQLERQKEFLIKAAYWSTWGIAAFLLLKFVGAVLLPFFAAFLVAALFCRPVDIVAEKTHLKRNLVAVFVIVLFYVCIGGFFYFMGNRLAGLVQSIFDELTVFLSETIFPMLEKFLGWVEQISGAAKTRGTGTAGGADSAEVFEKAGKMLSGISGKAIDGVSNVAVCIPGFFMKIVIAVIATVFMELEFHDILKFFGSQIPEKWKKTVADGKEYCMGTLGRCILSYGMLLALTYGELTVGFLILGIDGAFVIAFIIAVLDILPVLGTGTVLLPWGVIAFSTGNLKMGTGILILYLTITVVRNIVEPKIVGKQIGLSPVVMLPCMLVGLKLFGIIGMLGMPLAVAFLKSLNDRGIIHILKPISKGE